VERLIEHPTGLGKHRNYCRLRQSDGPSVRGIFHFSRVALPSFLSSIIVWKYKRWVIATLSLLFVGQWVLVFVGTWVLGIFNPLPFSTLPSRPARRKRHMESSPGRVRPHRLPSRVCGSVGSLLILQYVGARVHGLLNTERTEFASRRIRLHCCHFHGPWGQEV